MKKIILGLAITLLVAGCSNIESSDKNTFENKSVKLSTVGIFAQPAEKVY